MPSISSLEKERKTRFELGLRGIANLQLLENFQAFSILEVSDSSIAFQVSRGHVLSPALAVGIPRDMYLTCLTRRSVNGGADDCCCNLELDGCPYALAPICPSFGR